MVQFCGLISTCRLESFLGLIKAVIIKNSGQVKFSTVISLLECELTLPAGRTQRNVYFAKSYKSRLELFPRANVMQNVHFCKLNSLCFMLNHNKIKPHIVNTTFRPITHTISHAEGMHNCAANLCMKWL